VFTQVLFAAAVVVGVGVFHCLPLELTVCLELNCPP
jgi:hypothetical protein